MSRATSASGRLWSGHQPIWMFAGNSHEVVAGRRARSFNCRKCLQVCGRKNLRTWLPTACVLWLAKCALRVIAPRCARAGPLRNDLNQEELSPIAGLAHPVGTGEVRAAVCRTLIVEGALFSRGRSAANSSGMAGARALAGASACTTSDAQRKPQRTDFLRTQEAATSNAILPIVWRGDDDSTDFPCWRRCQRVTARSATSSGRRGPRGRGLISHGHDRGGALQRLYQCVSGSGH